MKQFLTYVNAAPFQPAIAVGLRMPDAFFADAAATLASKRDLLSAGLRAAGFDVARPDGSYFVVADAAPLGHPDAVEFCRRLPELAGRGRDSAHRFRPSGPARRVLVRSSASRSASESRYLQTHRKVSPR